MRIRISALLMLASTMALAQAGFNGANPPGQSQNSQGGQPGTSALNPIQQTLRGCLRQSGESWTLSQSSQDTALSGDASLLKPHDGQQVEVQGTQPIGGTLQVTSVITISSSCIGQSNSTKTTPALDSTSTKTENQSSTKGQSGTSSKPSEPSNSPGASGQPPAPSQTQSPSGSGSDSPPPAKPPRTK